MRNSLDSSNISVALPWLGVLVVVGLAGACSGGDDGAPAAGGAANGSGGSAAGGATGSGGGSNASGGSGATFEYKACADDQRVGGFSLQLNPPKGDTVGTSSLTGGVFDKVNPRDVWVVSATEGDCKLLLGPTLLCAPSCTQGQICAGSNNCIANPAVQSVGKVTITGLDQPLEVAPGNDKTYYGPISGTYQPVAAGTSVVLTAAGDGAYKSFTLSGAGITSLEVPTEKFALESGKPVNLSWPAGGGTQSRMLLTLDIAHHGGIFAKIKCDVPDTGSASVPAGLVTKLVETGTAGFPVVGFTRRTISSTNVESGCVDFAVSSYVERSLEVAGVTSCNCSNGEDCDAPCPNPGQICKTDRSCE
jgi:hypothetical protein